MSGMNGGTPKGKLPQSANGMVSLDASRKLARDGSQRGAMPDLRPNLNRAVGVRGRVRAEI